jgi:hypothetical protein
MDQDAASSGSSPAIKHQRSFPQFAFDLVRRAADEIRVQTANVMFYLFRKSGDRASHPSAGMCRAANRDFLAYLRRTAATPAFQLLNLL